jgi:hypothetical protein
MRSRITLVGILAALCIAGSVKTALAMDCGCSGSACGGCSITYQNCTSCTKNCSECAVFGTEDCEIGWQCVQG